MRLAAAIGLGFGLLGAVATAHAADCPGNPGALGTSRVLKIDPREYPRLGTIQYQETLPLADKEVVLTFDDGPMPPYTTRVLEILAHECVKANYFVIGRMARGYPDLMRRIQSEGHVIGTHSENHPLAFDKMPPRAFQAEIDQGIASAAAALGNRDAVAPFFRIPGLLRAEGVESYLRSKGLTVWSADVAADDWKHITASEVVSRSLSRLDSNGKGILLLHDIQPATALALPHLLRELKRRGYRIVQVAPAPPPAAVPVANLPKPPVRAAVLQQTQQAARPAPVSASPPASAVVRPEPQVPAQTQVPTPIPAQVSAHASAVQAPAVSQAAAAGAPASAPAASAPARSDPHIAAAPAAATPVETRAAEAEPPSPRGQPVPILDLGMGRPSRSAPASELTDVVTRPLTPGFKPSHNTSLPQKVSELPPEHPKIDTWGMLAGLPAGTVPPVRTPWPVPAVVPMRATPR